MNLKIKNPTLLQILFTNKFQNPDPLRVQIKFYFFVEVTRNLFNLRKVLTHFYRLFLSFQHFLFDDHLFKNKNTSFTDIFGTKLRIKLNVKNDTCQIEHLTKYAILSQKCWYNAYFYF